jgi:FixJ family two-component response regulator
MHALAYCAWMMFVPGLDEGARELVAIVDDDASVRQSLARLIRSLGYGTQLFGSADEFLGSTAPASTACLLLDVRMPGMDGITLQRHLVERGDRIAIVFITAQATDEEERRARSAGAIDFLRKPIDQAALRHALDRALRAARSPRGDRDVGGGKNVE